LFAGSKAKADGASSMNVDSVRAYCLSFSRAKETLQWGETLCFKINGKIFATLSLDSVPPSLCFKCTPDRFADLCEQEGIRPAPYVGRYKWVLLERLDALGDEEMKDLIHQSHDMVAPKGRAKVKGEKIKVNINVKSLNHPSTSLRAGSGHKRARRKES
jgi:predicted DNA-binding protein (MmcQ/YjbR family)